MKAWKDWGWVVLDLSIIAAVTLAYMLVMSLVAD